MTPFRARTGNPDVSQTSGRGFTLIELLVVIAIIGILSALGLVSLHGAREKARDSDARTDLGQMRTALELFAADFQSGEPYVYPSEAGDDVPDYSADRAGQNATPNGIWVSGGQMIPDYLGAPLQSPSDRRYGYITNRNALGGAPDRASEYALFYQLEAGDGLRYYVLFTNGQVVDYRDNATAEPDCDDGGTCYVPAP